VQPDVFEGVRREQCERSDAVRAVTVDHSPEQPLRYDECRHTKRVDFASYAARLLTTQQRRTCEDALDAHPRGQRPLEQRRPLQRHGCRLIAAGTPLQVQVSADLRMVRSGGAVFADRL
jgi:hypothetical protein